MISVINNFLMHLVGVSNIVLKVADTEILNFNISYYLFFTLILFATLYIATIFFWFFHIIFEKCE